MAILDKIKIGIDTPKWLQMKPLNTTHAAGTLLCCDHRNSIWNDNAIYQVASTANLYRTSEWYNGTQLMTASLSLAALAVGGFAGFMPNWGIYGVIGAGCSTTKIVTSTALTLGSGISALGTNQLVKTDMPNSYMIGIFGKTSGKTEYRTVIANTASATPVLYLDSALSFTPSANDEYIIFSGQIAIVAATTAAAGQTRIYGVAGNTVANGGSTGITTGTAASGCVLDEMYVPYNMNSGEGVVIGSGTYDTSTPYSAVYGNAYLRCLVATASAAGTLTGQASGGDAIVAQNEYRNFQIRIVEDTGTPTAVGQRRIISSHTAGASPVYTLASNWSVTPSATAKYVIEYPNIILLQSNTQAGMLVYNYNPNTITGPGASINAFTWSSTYFDASTATVHAAVVTAGTMCFPACYHQPTTQSDGTRLSRHSYIYFFRGGATLDLFDMAGAADGTWSNNITYNNPVSFTAGSSGDIDNYQWEGEYAYIVQNATAQMYQFDIVAPSIVPWVQLPAQSGTAAGSQRVCILAHVPPEPIPPATTVTWEDKLSMIYVQSHLANALYRSDIIG